MVRENIFGKITLWVLILAGFNIATSQYGFNFIKIIGNIIPGFSSVIIWLIGASGIYKLLTEVFK